MKVSKHCYQNGFTLLELILVMFLGLVVISLVYAVYANVHRMWTNFHEKQSGLISLTMFKNTLDRDIDRSIFITKTGDGRYLFIAKADTTEYRFADRIIRSRGAARDSFSISVAHVEPEYVVSMKSSYIIDRISLAISAPLIIDGVTFTKRYTSSELITLFHQTNKHGP